MANRIAGGGQVLTSPRDTGSRSGGCYARYDGAPGKLRFEAFQQAFSGTISGTLLPGSPFDTFVPTTGSSQLTILSVGGVAVNPNPTGSFLLPDVTINAGDPVPIVIRTQNIPAGTVIRLQLFSENGPSQVIDFPALTGTAAVKNATASVRFLSGFSRGFVRATFTR
jgi:hypothetical protein